MEKILEDKKIGTCPRPPAHFVVHDVTRQLDDPLCPVSISVSEDKAINTGESIYSLDANTSFSLQYKS